MYRRARTHTPALTRARTHTQTRFIGTLYYVACVLTCFLSICGEDTVGGGY